MNRRSLLRMTGLAGLAATAGGVVHAMRPPRNPYYNGPVSDHFDGLRFFNPGGVAPHDLTSVLRWQRERAKAPWPASAPLAFGPARPDKRLGGAHLRLTLVGHATFLLQVAGLNILTDPVWADRASPLRFAGPRRVTEPGIAFADLPPIDVILLSHNHYDHLCTATLARLHAAHDPLVITPLGNDRIIRQKLPEMRCLAVDWGDAVALGDAGVKVHTLPCHHWSARGTRDRSMALWAAFGLTTPAGTVFHIGDTGFDNGRPYQDLPRILGPIRAAILPIGAYEPRWFMKAQHQNPQEAVQGFALSGAAYAAGHHWGTFQLTDEPRNAPATALAAALAEQGIAPSRFRAMQAGEVWDLPETS
jgi:L-ascorbate metabolism protein UlaG (beta-lactamase superfamily)